jgi:hypothetical protein
MGVQNKETLKKRKRCPVFFSNHYAATGATVFLIFAH